MDSDSSTATWLISLDPSLRAPLLSVAARLWRGDQRNQACLQHDPFAHIFGRANHRGFLFLLGGAMGRRGRPRLRVSLVGFRKGQRAHHHTAV